MKTTKRFWLALSASGLLAAQEPWPATSRAAGAQILYAGGEGSLGCVVAFWNCYLLKNIDACNYYAMYCKPVPPPPPAPIRQ